jgi:hypothetical protein
LFRGFLRRQKQPKASKQTSNPFASLTEGDLADMGLKRYQLEQNSAG